MGDVAKLQKLLLQVRQNRKLLKLEVAELQKTAPASRVSEPPQDHQRKKQDDAATDQVSLPRSQLLRLQREIKMLKTMVANVVSQDLLPAYTQLDTLSREAESARQVAVSAETEKCHWQSRWESAVEDSTSEKQEKQTLRVELQEVTQNLGQQSEFFASMGAACCTLLWRVSRCEDSIPTLVVGTKAEEFLGLVCTTLDSYLETYREDIPPDTADETQFVLALCGIITNVAASAFGRDFLMKSDNGRQLVDVGLTVLNQQPLRKFNKMKNLILMALYNLSINQKGLQYIVCKPGLVGLLSWGLHEDNEADNRLNSLRLLQSLLYEPQSADLVHQVKEQLPADFLEALCRDKSPDIRQGATELMTDILLMKEEQ